MSSERKEKALKQYAELIINKINEVSSDWERPWFTTTFATQNINGRQYHGTNDLILSLICEQKQYKTGAFLTQSQIKNDKILIKKGEKATYISYYDIRYKSPEGNYITLKEYNLLPDSDKSLYTKQAILKYYSVFNIEQTNFPEKHPESWKIFLEKFNKELTPKSGDYANTALDKVLNEQLWLCPVNLKAQDHAFYNWKNDEITLPLREQFTDSKAFYSTTLHEMIHSTGHPSRLHRAFGHFGDERYAKEELIAELSSAFLGKQLGIAVLPRKENAQYLKNWLEAINKDSSYIYDILGDVKSACTLTESNIASTINEISGKITIDNPNIYKLEKESGNNIIFIVGTRTDGTPFRTPVYNRGNDYCFTVGSIIDGDISTHFLDNEVKSKVDYLRSDEYKGKSGSIELITSSASTVKESAFELSVSTARRSITITNEKAIIKYGEKTFDATPILTSLTKNNINPSDISETQWKSLLNGQGLQLDNTNKAIFSIKKTPSGYDLKIIKEIIKNDATELIK